MKPKPLRREVVQAWNAVAVLAFLAVAIGFAKGRMDAYRRSALEAGRLRGALELTQRARDGRLNDLRRLVEAGADVNAISEQGTALAAALWAQQIDCADYLLAHGARTDLNSAFYSGNLLNSACHLTFKDPGQAGRLLAIQRRLIRDGLNINDRDRALGYTPLISSSLLGAVPIAKDLIAHGADVNAVESQGNTPLHWAAENGRTEMAQLLLRHGANADVKNRMGDTPLQIAIRRKRPAIVRLLRIGTHAAAAP